MVSKSKEVAELDMALEEIQIAKKKLDKLRGVIKEIKSDKKGCGGCGKVLKESTRRVDKMVHKARKEHEEL